MPPMWMVKDCGEGERGKGGERGGFLLPGVLGQKKRAKKKRALFVVLPSPSAGDGPVRAFRNPSLPTGR